MQAAPAATTPLSDGPDRMTSERSVGVLQLQPSEALTTTKGALIGPPFMMGSDRAGPAWGGQHKEMLLP